MRKERKGRQEDAANKAMWPKSVGSQQVEENSGGASSSSAGPAKLTRETTQVKMETT